MTIHLSTLTSAQLSQLDAAITSLETSLEELQERGIVEDSGIDLIELSEAVAAELEFREAVFE